MEAKKCKKCGRPLPDNYGHKKCENCRNQEVKALKVVLGGVGILIGGTMISIATRGKITPQKK